MRLTLRTLLAYLDNTLDPQDAEVLKNKLSESGFATQLVQRISRVMVNGNLSAPAPDAMGPVEEANVIGEYLDSTLPVEQVAEIERACLESDAHLAEAAACHQVLTIVLKKPAEIPQELRRRIYELPDRQVEDIIASGSFSGLSIPADSPSLQPLVSDLPTSEATAARVPEPIRPVGPDDSGVSDAPTRLREAEVGLPATESGVATAGSRPRSLDPETRIYGGSIRPSRIAPWLVSLGLAAVLLFVLAQLFEPLFNRNVDVVAELPETVGEESSEQRLASSEEAESRSVPANESESTAQTENGEPEPENVQPEIVEPGVVEPETVASGDVEPDGVSSVATLPEPAGTTTPESDQTAESDQGLGSRANNADGDDRVAAASAPAPTSDADRTDDIPVNAEAAADRGAPVPAPPQPQPPMVREVEQDADKPQPMPSDDPDRIEVAKVVAADTLVAAMVGEQWVRLNQDATVVDGVKVFCAPTFRCPLLVNGGEVTLIGPSQVEWVSQDDGRVSLWLQFGRLLLASTEPDLVVPIQLGEERMELRFAEPNSIAALEVTHFRAPGFDPLIPENRIPVTRVLLVEGKLAIESEGRQEDLQIGQERRRRGVGEPEMATVEQLPGWVDPVEAPLDASARAGLMELLNGTQPLKLQLREAAMFRRSEVAALAARSLVGMGHSEVYFGGGGILSEPKQRTYWPDHYTEVLAVMDRSAESAAQVHDAIVRMDAANATELLRLLNGYSQKQLAEGADAELVEALNSPSMAVRVLALENLHKITGTTLYFYPGEENAVRRAPTIKKWEARLRKGDIRWQE